MACRHKKVASVGQSIRNMIFLSLAVNNFKLESHEPRHGHVLKIRKESLFLQTAVAVVVSVNHELNSLMIGPPLLDREEEVLVN